MRPRFGIEGRVIGRGERDFGQAHPTEKDDIGVVFDKLEPGEVLDVEAVDGVGPIPLERFEGLDGRETSPANASFDGANLLAGGLFPGPSACLARKRRPSRILGSGPMGGPGHRQPRGPAHWPSLAPEEGIAPSSAE